MSALAAPYDVDSGGLKHLKVLEGAGLVREDATRAPAVHLEAEVFDLMTKWIE